MPSAHWAAAKRVVIVQFLKGGQSGEIPLLAQLGAKIFRGKGGQKFVFQMNEAEKAAARAVQNENLTAALAEPADLLILDEPFSLGAGHGGQRPAPAGRSGASRPHRNAC